MPTTDDATESQQQWKAPPTGSPCWIEIPAQNTERLKAFYAAIFPWKWRPEHGESTENKHKVLHYSFAGQNGLSGGIVQQPEGCGLTEQAMGSGMTVYYMVDSLDEVQKKVHEHGGNTCLDKSPESSHGWIMNFRDPEGNRFGCYQIRLS